MKRKEIVEKVPSQHTQQALCAQSLQPQTCALLTCPSCSPERLLEPALIAHISFQKGRHEIGGKRMGSTYATRPPLSTIQHLLNRNMKMFGTNQTYSGWDWTKLTIEVFPDKWCRTSPQPSMNKQAYYQFDVPCEETTSAKSGTGDQIHSQLYES